MFKRNSRTVAIFRLPTDLKKRFIEVANNNDLQFSDALRQAMRHWINRKDMS